MSNSFVIVHLINCSFEYVSYAIPRNQISDSELKNLNQLNFRFSNAMRGNEKILSHFRSGEDKFMDHEYYSDGQGKWFEFLIDKNFNLNLQIEASFCFEFTSLCGKIFLNH